MKQYNLRGVGANVELGKKGTKIIGSNSSQIAFISNSGNAAVASIAEGTAPTHAVTKQQLDAAGGQSFQRIDKMVSYNSGTVAIGTASANAWVHRVVVDADAAWTNANDATTITVGDSDDPDRLFVGFDPSMQTADETDYKYSNSTVINAYVTSGGATAGTAKVVVWFSGKIEE
jgi:hypothetical protein